MIVIYPTSEIYVTESLKEATQVSFPPAMDVYDNLIQQTVFTVYRDKGAYMYKFMR